MANVAGDGHAERTGEGFERSFYLVVFVASLGFDIKVHECGIGEAFEKMEKHLGGHSANPFALLVGLPNEPGAAAEIEGALAEAIIHG